LKPVKNAVAVTEKGIKTAMIFIRHYAAQLSNNAANGER